MGIFYDMVKKMRENGNGAIKPFTTKTEVKTKTKPIAETEKPKETAVKKNDKGTGRKS